MLLRKLLFLLVLLSLVLITGCGRYSLPIAPELTSPSQIKFQGITPNEQSVTLKWSAPETDRRGRKLNLLQGYKIYRRDVPLTKYLREQQGDTYELVAIVLDDTVSKRQKLEQERRAEFKSGRQVKLSAEDLTVEFSDQDLEVGHLYLYKIVPYNSFEAEGLVKSYIELLFNGVNSVVRQIYTEDDAGMILNKVVEPVEEEQLDNSTSDIGQSSGLKN